MVLSSINFANFSNYSAMIIYLIGVLAIGVYFSRNEKNSEDFLLGGRSMPFVAIGISCMMSLFSSISIVVIPGEIFRHGLTLYFFGLLISPMLVIPCFLLFTRFYFKLGSFTPYEYLEYRYSPAIRSLVAGASLYMRTIYLGMVLYTTSKIFEGAYNWDPIFTIMLVGAVGILYTVMGGMKAVVWSDVMQFVVLIIGFTAAVIYLCINIDGGFLGAISHAVSHGRGLPQLSQREFYGISPYVRLLFYLLIWRVIADNLLVASSDQITIQRLLSTKNWKEGLKSQILSTCITIPFGLILWFVGMALFSYYSQNPNKNMADPDGIFFYFVSNKMPAPFPGIFMAAMLAAIMSTLDSGINSMATVWLKEFHQKYFNKNMTGKEEVHFSRYATFVFGVIGIGLALLIVLSGDWVKQSVAEIAALVAIFTAMVLPAFLFAVLSSRANSFFIWLLTLYSAGDALLMKAWYALSRFDLQHWKPGDPLGWAGPLPWYYVAILFSLGVFFLILWYVYRKSKRKKLIFGCLLVAAFFFGAFQATAIWAFFSNWLIRDVPQARSFIFQWPITILVGAIVLRFFPKRPVEEYQGLTIFTVNKKVLRKPPK